MIRTILVVLLLVVGVFAVVAFFVLVKLYRIPSSAMEPTLRCAKPALGCTGAHSDRIAAIRIEWPFDHVHRGEVVAFETPPAAREKCGVGGTFVKRIVGLPGETFEERRGVVYIDGERLSEPYVDRDRRDEASYPPRTIPPDRYFLLGDNRAQSCDSRVWGSVPKSNLTAHVFAIYWPPSRLGFR